MGKLPNTSIISLYNWVFKKTYSRKKCLDILLPNILMEYSIVQAKGKQFWIEVNRFYDFSSLPFEVGSFFFFNKVLFVSKSLKVLVGAPFIPLEQCTIKVTVLKHFLDRKVKVYKMRPKKKSRKTFGSRLKLTR